MRGPLGKSGVIHGKLTMCLALDMCVLLVWCGEVAPIYRPKPNKVDMTITETIHGLYFSPHSRLHSCTCMTYRQFLMLYFLERTNVVHYPTIEEDTSLSSD